jgi:polysaccharide pyruvyl transferase WcaK-like protein
MQHRKIAILHHLGGGNLGDEASMTSVIQGIRSRWPDAEIHAFTMNPEDTSARHGIPAFPIRRHTWSIGYQQAAKSGNPTGKGLAGWLASTHNPIIRKPRAVLREAAFYLRTIMAVRKYDDFVISGGGQLTGRSGPWSFPFGIFLWVSAAKLAGIRRIILNIGAGPLNSRLVNFFSIRSLKAANYVSFRDAESKALARSKGFEGAAKVFPDNAYLLDIPKALTSRIAAARPVVGIAPMPYPFCDPREIASGHQQIYEDCMGKFAAFASRLANSSFSVELFGTDISVDPKAIEDVRILLLERYQIQLPSYQTDGSLYKLLSRTAGFDYVVTCRFHGVVLAHMLNKPVLALAHHRKVTTVMADLGLSEYCFNIADFSVNQITEAFDSMVSRSTEIKERMAASLGGYREQLRAQFDELFPPAYQSLAGHTPLEEIEEVGRIQ